jgi:septum formation protein
MLDTIATTPPRLILASSSPYRKQLLARLDLPFCCIAPDIDESPLPEESPLDTAIRLAQNKAAVIAKQHPKALVIGSDQVACLHGVAIGKPGNHARALAQLQQMRGERVAFHTALCLWDGRDPTKTTPFASQVVSSYVTFRSLPDAELDAYLHLEQPYDCAGSAKNEALGIALLEKIESTDPTALTGLPLIALTSMLRQAGVAFFNKKN